MAKKLSLDARVKALERRFDAFVGAVEGLARELYHLTHPHHRVGSIRLAFAFEPDCLFSLSPGVPMNLVVGTSVIATILEFAPSDPNQQTPLSPAVPFDAPPSVSVSPAGVVNATVLPDNTIQFDGIAEGTASVSVSVLIGGQVFTASASFAVAAVQPPPPQVGSIGLSFGTPFPTPSVATPQQSARVGAGTGTIGGTGKP